MKTRSRSKPAPRPPRGFRFSLHATPETPPGESRALTIAAIIVAIAFAAGLVWMIAGPHRIGDYMTETDFYGDYAKGARLVQHGVLLPSRYGVVGPGYEIALGLVGFVIRDLFVAAQLLSAASMVTVLLLWFHLLRRRAGPRAALVAVLFMAANAHCFHYGYAATTDALALALQAASLDFLLARGGTRSLAVAGLFAALAFLTRYNAVYLLPAGIVAALAGGTGAGGAPVAGATPAAPLRARTRAALVFTAAFAAPIVPWVIYSLTHGSSFSFQLHHNIAYEVFARAKGIPWDTYQKELQPQFRTLWDVIRRDPGAVASRMLFNLVDHLRLDAQSLLGWPTAIAAALGLAIAAADGALRRLWPLWLAAALLFLSLVPAFHSPRYSLALLPAYATLAALAFTSPRLALALGRGGRIWLKPALALIPLGASLSGSIATQRMVIDQLPTEVLECARTLERLKQPGDRLIARKWHVAFHAGMDPVPFPFADSLADLAAYARAHRARWLYVSWPEVETRPQFYYLLDTSSAVPGLTVRHVTAPHPAVVYEVGADFGRPPAWAGNDTMLALHVARAREKIEGDNVQLLVNLAQLERATGHLDAARAAAARAARLAPANAAALTTLAGIALDQEDGAAALAVLRRAAALDPGNPALHVGIGWALLQLGRDREAAAEWRPLIDSTGDPGLLQTMSEVFRHTGDLDSERRALAALRRLGRTP